MKWYALRRKDGEVLQVASNRKSLEHLRSIIRNYEGCEIVEVDIIEAGTAEALKRAREAWDMLVTCRASVNAPPEHRGLMEVAMQTLGKVLGRVTDNAASDGGDKEAGE